MKLLIVTQALDINDPILGFFHRWVYPVKFSKILWYVLRIRVTE